MRCEEGSEYSSSGTQHNQMPAPFYAANSRSRLRGRGEMKRPSASLVYLTTRGECGNDVTGLRELRASYICTGGVTAGMGGDTRLPHGEQVISRARKRRLREQRQLTEQYTTPIMATRSPVKDAATRGQPRQSVGGGLGSNSAGWWSRELIILEAAILADLVFWRVIGVVSQREREADLWLAMLFDLLAPQHWGVVQLSS